MINLKHIFILILFFILLPTSDSNRPENSGNNQYLVGESLVSLNGSIALSGHLLLSVDLDDETRQALLTQGTEMFIILFCLILILYCVVCIVLFKLVLLCFVLLCSVTQYLHCLIYFQIIFISFFLIYLTFIFIHRYFHILSSS